MTRTKAFLAILLTLAAFGGWRPAGAAPVRPLLEAPGTVVTPIQYDRYGGSRHYRHRSHRHHRRRDYRR